METNQSTGTANTFVTQTKGRPVRAGEHLLKISPFPLLYLTEGIVGVGATVGLLYLLHATFATVGFLLLPIVLLVAMRGGFWAATAVSLFANLCLDYFFVPPFFTITIDSPENWVALIVFEVSALVVGGLSAKMGTHRAHALRSRKEMKRLHQLAVRLLLLNQRRHDQDSAVFTQLLLALKDNLQARTIVLFEPNRNGLKSIGLVDYSLEREVQGSYLLQESIRSAAPGNTIRILHLGSHVIGAIGMNGVHLSAQAADAIADLVVIALQSAATRPPLLCHKCESSSQSSAFGLN